jgi:hypothetical protein
METMDARCNFGELKTYRNKGVMVGGATGDGDGGA